MTALTHPPDDVDTPEGSVWRKVRMSETLFRLLGASGVEWGEPDEDGFHTPTVYLGPDGAAKWVNPTTGRRVTPKLGKRCRYCGTQL